MSSKLAKNFMSLAEAYPEIASEWDYEKNTLNPDEIGSRSSSKASWKGKCGHSWQQVVSSRTKLGYGCTICRGKEILAGFNDLATLNPELAKEWDSARNEKLASEVPAKGDEKVWWKCSLGHEWQCSTRQRSDKGTQCSICCNRVTFPGFNDLATLNPVLASEWDFSKNYDIPSTMNPKSTEKRWWKCSLGHSWASAVHSRHVAKIGCPICSHKQLLVGYNDLAFTAPLLAQEWHPTKNSLSPNEVINGSNIKVWWICKEKHEWEALLPNRLRQNRGCPYCTRQKITPGEGDLATTNPHLITEWNFQKNSISPSEVGFGSEKLVWWICSKSHEWQSIIRNRVIGRNCPTCSNRKILPGFNDLLTLNPSLAKEWHPTKNDKPASMYGAGSAFKVWWLCSKGHEWKSTIVNRYLLLRGCEKCSRIGTSKSEQAFRNEFKKFFTSINVDHTERVKLVGKDRALQLDIVGVFKDKKIAIEYDGIYFHSSEKKIKSDTEHTYLLLKNDYLVVRIRENNLPFIKISQRSLFQITHQFSYAPHDVQETSRKILDWLESII